MESYELNWIGKEKAKQEAFTNSHTALIENNEWNQKEESRNSQNLLIKGDNLDVLKHLMNDYQGKIKMIYIDPPYNTGHIFMFEDSKTHSEWLTFMYPRLYLARQLLKEDGMIFVSIDDNEVAQLRLLMNEIYEEENFVATFVRKSSINARKSTKNIAISQDYIVCYAKESSKLRLNKADGDKTRYIYEDEYLKERGRYRIHIFRKNNSYIESMDFPITAPNGEQLWPGDYPDNKEWRWAWSKEKVKWGIENGFIYFQQSNNGKQKVYLKEYEFVNSKNEKSIRNHAYDTLIMNAFNDIGTHEIKELFNAKVFDHSKPLKLIKHLLKISTNDSDIILDFFAGSGTTGHAVWNLNVEDEGHRKFILVQIDEPIDSKKNRASYDFVKNKLRADPTIFEITKERLIRASKKIRENHDIKDQDLGFKIFEIKPIRDIIN